MSVVALRGLLPYVRRQCAAAVVGQTYAPENSLTAEDLIEDCFAQIRFFGATRTLRHLHGSRRRDSEANDWPWYSNPFEAKIAAKKSQCEVMAKQ